MAKKIELMHRKYDDRIEGWYSILDLKHAVVPDDQVGYMDGDRWVVEYVLDSCLDDLINKYYFTHIRHMNPPIFKV